MKPEIKRSLMFVIAMFLANVNYAAHVIVPPATSYLVGTSAPYNTLHGGDTLLMTSGNKAYIYLKDFTGSSTAPIVVINYGGIVTIGTNYNYGVKIGGCRYIKFTGTGTGAMYGFQVTQTNGDGISIGDLSSDVEVNHVYISNCGIRGIVAKTDPACGGYAYRSNFTQYNTIIHHNLIENTTTEGMYIGSSFYNGEVMTCSGVDSTIYPSILNGCQIYNNIVRHTGYDGIQAASALNLSVHDNLVQYDSYSGTSSQMSGILIGGGSQGDCYNNYIQNGKGDGIDNLGLGGYKIYNNVIVNAGLNYYPGNQSYPKFGIYTNDCSATQGSEFDLMFNTIISPKTAGMKFASLKATASMIENNAIVSPGQAGSYIINNGYSGITIRNNYTSATIAPAMFTDTTYKTNPGSPLIDAGYPETRGITTDKFGNARSQGPAPDCGVYEASGTVFIPAVTTSPVTNIAQTTATSGGNVTSDGGAAVTARGVCWGTGTCPLITGNHTSDGTGTGSFVSSIAGLTAGTLYYVRAYATNSAGISYGNEFSFTTLTLPTVTTAAVTNIAQTTATSGGNVTSTGGATVTARGVCWGTATCPLITGNHTSDGTGIGSFVSSITGLTAGTLYYVRAYATNSAGTSYGN
ncbi:MAG: right-handed parallel beta-helix repeat-containing protein, partial [Bacteroidetes bacterium]|nr:right-handed parallel beta-helix repeat-containing protein [Bacteroidota bacterium]